MPPCSALAALSVADIDPLQEIIVNSSAFASPLRCGRGFGQAGSAHPDREYCSRFQSNPNGPFISRSLAIAYGASRREQQTYFAGCARSKHLLLPSILCQKRGLIQISSVEFATAVNPLKPVEDPLPGFASICRLDGSFRVSIHEGQPLEIRPREVRPQPGLEWHYHALTLDEYR